MATALKFLITVGPGSERMRSLGVLVFTCPLQAVNMVKKLKSNRLFSVIVVFFASKDIGPQLSWSFSIVKRSNRDVNVCKTTESVVNQDCITRTLCA